MREISAFFRHCPACARRFHIKLMKKEEVEEHTFKEGLTVSESDMGGLLHGDRWALPLPLSEGAPVLVDVEQFRYSYRCTHCGHEWAETREKEREFKA